MSACAITCRRWTKTKRAHPGQPPLPRNPGFRLLLGSEFDFGRFKLVAIAHDLQGWGNLCEFITAARNTQAPKGEYRVDWATSDVASLRHCEVLFVPRRVPGAALDMAVAGADVANALALFGANLWIAVELLNDLDDDLWLASLQQLANQAGVPLVAAGDVHMHKRSRKPLQDVVTAIREGKSVAECGFALQPNAERHLRSRLRLADLYPPDLLANTLVVMQAAAASISNSSASTTSTRSKTSAAERLPRRRWCAGPGRARATAIRMA